MTPLYLAATVALILGAIELACRWVDHMPDPVDDTLPDWIRRLRDDMTACEPDGLISEIYAFLKEQAK